MKSSIFTVETTAEHTSLSHFMDWDTPIILKGHKSWLWDEYSYVLTGWEILGPEGEKASGTPELLNILFENSLDEIRKEMIQLHEAEQSDNTEDDEYEKYREAL